MFVRERRGRAGSDWLIDGTRRGIKMVRMVQNWWVLLLFNLVQIPSPRLSKMTKTHSHNFYQSFLLSRYSLSLYISRIQPIPYWYDLKYPPALSSFLPCQEVSRKFLASTGCFSLFRMSCTVCCNPIQDFAFGSCDHKDLCANCMLHWLMLYKETTCPTCRVTLLPQYYD